MKRKYVYTIISNWQKNFDLHGLNVRTNRFIIGCIFHIPSRLYNYYWALDGIDHHDGIFRGFTVSQSARYTHPLLFQCWASVCESCFHGFSDVSGALFIWVSVNISLRPYCLVAWFVVGIVRFRDVEPTLFYCRANVADAEPALKQHWFHISCLLPHCQIGLFIHGFPLLLL